MMHKNWKLDAQLLMAILGVFVGACAFFQFHPRLDDFERLQSLLTCGEHCNILDLIPYHVALRFPYSAISAYFFILLEGSIKYIILIGLIFHALNSFLLFYFLKKWAKKNEIAQTRRFADVPFLAAILFFLFPNNYEVLYWVKHIGVSISLTLVLLGFLSPWYIGSFLLAIGLVIFPFHASVVVAFFAYIFMAQKKTYKDIFSNNKTFQSFMLTIGIGILIFTMVKITFHVLSSNPTLIIRLMDPGFLGFKVVLRVLGYTGFLVSVRTFQQEYTVTTWIARVLIFICLSRFVMGEKRLTFLFWALVVSWVVTLIPSSCYEYLQPRELLVSSVVLSLILGLVFAHTSRSMFFMVCVAFAFAQFQTIYTGNKNAKILKHAEERLLNVVQKNASQSEVLKIQPVNFFYGYEKDLMFQGGYPFEYLKTLIQKKIKESSGRGPRLDFVSTCEGVPACVVVDFLEK